MKRIGIWLAVFGVLSFALPRFGYDLRWFEILGPARDPMAVALIVVGGALLLFAANRKRASDD